MDKITKKESFLPMIHESCMDIVRTIDVICRNNNIQYSLCGGSVIGAHLYSGFIPWDDDIDLMMTRKNYDRFLDVFPKEAHSRFHLLNYRLDSNACVPTLFSRVEDQSTEVTEEIAGNVRFGHVFVDITVIDNVSSNAMHGVAFLYGCYVYSKLYRHCGMTPGTRWKQMVFKLMSVKDAEEKSLRNYTKFEEFCRKGSEIETKYCAELMSAAYSLKRYRTELFSEYSDIEFEGTPLMIISNYMDYLRMRYGDREFVKEVPSEERFNSHITAFRSGLC